MFGDNIFNDKALLSYLTTNLGYSRPARLLELMTKWKASSFMKTPKQLSMIHNEWVTNSVVTVDRRNTRDLSSLERVNSLKSLELKFLVKL